MISNNITIKKNAKRPSVSAPLHAKTARVLSRAKGFAIADACLCHPINKRESIGAVGGGGGGGGHLSGKETLYGLRVDSVIHEGLAHVG